MVKAIVDSTARIDRTVTLGLLLTVFVQTGGALIWAGSAEARIKALEAQGRLMPNISERLTRMEEQMTVSRSSLERIEARLNGAPKNVGAQP